LAIDINICDDTYDRHSESWNINLTNIRFFNIDQFFRVFYCKL